MSNAYVFCSSGTNTFKYIYMILYVYNTHATTIRPLIIFSWSNFLPYVTSLPSQIFFFFFLISYCNILTRYKQITKTVTSSTTTYILYKDRENVLYLKMALIAHTNHIYSHNESKTIHKRTQNFHWQRL